MMRVAPAVLVLLAACGDPRVADHDAAIAIDAAPPGPPPAVIIMIGDGMGLPQMAAASRYRHGVVGGLAMEDLPFRGQVRSGGPSGITDSAAAATVMASGVYTYNGSIGVDRGGRPVENLVERAHAHGWAAGVVTTTTLPHATPAGFSAHVTSRTLQSAIADQMVRATKAEVMLGGGRWYFAPQGVDSGRTDNGLYDELTAAGYPIAFTADELTAAVARGEPRLFGAFATDMMTYVSARPPGTREPMLIELAAAALTTLDRDPDGFVLMIEGGRIDHGGHANNLVDVVQETLAFDDTVAMVAGWAAARGNTTLLVTADHECGGLEVVQPAPAGQYPTVRWRWGNHTNARVAVMGQGPGAERVDGAVLDQRWIHAIAAARIDGAALVVPAREPIPDGELGDLRHRAVVQRVATGFGAGFNQLDALWLDATSDGLYIGIEGLFEWSKNAVEVWIDVDPGAGTGWPGLAGALTDASGAADRVLTSSHVSTGQSALDADLVLVSLGGADPHVEDRWDDGGLRGVRPPYGQPADLGWQRAAINYGAVRNRDVAGPSVPGQGLEAFIPWSILYPGGPVPVGARLRLAAMMVNSTGEFTSNQFLPPLPAGAANPGTAAIALPGVVEYVVDGNSDGVVDGDRAPTVLP